MYRYRVWLDHYVNEEWNSFYKINNWCGNNLSNEWGIIKEERSEDEILANLECFPFIIRPERACLSRIISYKFDEFKYDIDIYVNGVFVKECVAYGFSSKEDAVAFILKWGGVIYNENGARKKTLERK